MKIGEYLAVGMFSVAPLFAGCGALDASIPCKASCNSTLYANSNEQGLGGAKLDMPDCYDMEQYGFEIVGSQDGGWGDTLHWSGCDGGVDLIWAYEELVNVKLSKGWEGRTDNGIGMGDNLSTILERYPKTWEMDSGKRIWVTNTREYSLRFWLDENENLEKLTLFNCEPDRTFNWMSVCREY